MSETNVEAIVIRRRDSGESDRRLTLLTRELGKIDVVAKGAKKSASRLAGSSEPLTVARMTLAKGKVNQFVTQSQPEQSFRGLRSDFDRLSLALALTELYAAILPWGEPNDIAFDLLLSSLEVIERHPKPIVAVVWAELKLLEEAGYLPPFDRCVITDVPVQEAAPWVSPTAGGYVVLSQAVNYRDSFQTRAEVLFGLARAAELNQPPGNLKYAAEGLMLLSRFWDHIIDAPLPANEVIKNELRHAHLNGD